MDFDTPFPGARKVAMVISALGNDVGAKILSNFSAPEVEAIIREVKDLETVSVGEVSELMGQLRDEAYAQSYAINGGLERARELLRKSHGAQADMILDGIIQASAAVPFKFLRQRRPDQIVSYLTGEHPQVVALVLAYLPLTIAGQVIEGLPNELRADVAERYAKLEGIDPGIVMEVEQALQRRVGSKAAVSDTNATKGGVKPLAQLLNSVNRDTERGVLTDLERADPDLASAIRDLMFVFEDIGGIDDRGLQEMLRQADTKTIALALKDTSPTLKDKIERNLSQRAGEDVAEFVASLGMVRRADVEAAQQEIVKIARKLEEEGKLTLSRGGGGGEGEFI
jgi:flagellar motor switch protein FliG